VAVALLALALLFVGYVLVFSTYVSGFARGKSSLPAAAWERAFRAAVLAGPVLALFLLLTFLAWAGRWRTGLLPFAVGAIGSLLAARLDAGLARPSDAAWAAPLLLVAWAAGRASPPRE
jgi:hypothetical protein